MIALLPLQYVNDYLFSLKLFRVIHLPRLLSMATSERMNKILNSCLKHNQKEGAIVYKYFIIYACKILKLLLVEIIITYFLAIILYIVVKKINPSGESETFLSNSEYDLDSLSEPSKIIVFMYFTMTTLTSVGYGDYYARTNVERIYMILVELIGVSFYSFIMGSFIELVGSYERKVGVVDKFQELENWLVSLRKHNKNMALDNHFHNEIEEHFKYFWSEYKLAPVLEKNSCLPDLPKKTRYFVIFIKNIDNVAVFV